MGNIVTAPPNRVAIISGIRGQRMLHGGCGFVLFCLEEVNWLSLEVMTITVLSTEAETVKGVKINIKAYAQVKVKAMGQDGKVDRASIRNAATNFLGKRQGEIFEAVQRTLEGHQRQIIGTLTVEELYKDRAAFSERVYEHVVDDLERLGFQLASYTVAEISDNNGYMTALGKTQISIVQREAAEGSSRNEAEAQKAISKANADAAMAVAENAQRAYVREQEKKEAEAEADRDLATKRADYAREVNIKEAEAVAAREIERALQLQKVKEAEAGQKFKEEEVMLKVKDIQILQTINIAKGEAEAIKTRAAGEAEKVRLVGKAQADIVEMRGQAENAILKEKAQIFKDYGQEVIVQVSGRTKMRMIPIPFSTHHTRTQASPSQRRIPTQPPLRRHSCASGCLTPLALPRLLPSSLLSSRGTHTERGSNAPCIGQRDRQAV